MCQGRYCVNGYLVVCFIWAILHHVVFSFFGEKSVPHPAIWPYFDYGQRFALFSPSLHTLNPLLTLFSPSFLSPACDAY